MQPKLRCVIYLWATSSCDNWKEMCRQLNAFHRRLLETVFCTRVQFGQVHEIHTSKLQSQTSKCSQSLEMFSNKRSSAIINAANAQNCEKFFVTRFHHLIPFFSFILFILITKQYLSTQRSNLNFYYLAEKKIIFKFDDSESHMLHA